MSRQWWRWAGLVGAALTLVGAARAADDKADAVAVERKAFDAYIQFSLRVLINHGADMYNAPPPDLETMRSAERMKQFKEKQHQACYELYRQALKDLAPLLVSYPELQKSVTAGLVEVESNADARNRLALKAMTHGRQALGDEEQKEFLRVTTIPGLKAFALRAIINDIRAAVPGQKAEGKAAAGGTLWDRLGGEAGVRKVIDDFVALAADDPKVDFTRGGKYKFTDEKLADLKQKLVEMVSQAAGGSLKYAGKSMKEVHKGMGITDAQFDALAADLKTALDKNGVKPEDRDAVLKAIAATRPDIVEKQ